MLPSFYLTPAVHRSSPGLIRTMKIWGTCDTFTQEHDFSYLCLCYATMQKGKRNKEVFALLSSLPPPRAVSSPSLGEKHWTCLCQRDVTSTGETSNGDDPQALNGSRKQGLGREMRGDDRQGTREEQTWRQSSKRDPQLEIVPSTWLPRVTETILGGDPSSVTPIIVGNGLAQQSIPYVHRTRHETFLMARSQPLSSCQQGWRTSLFREQSAQHGALPVLMVTELRPPSAPALMQRAGDTEFLPIWWLSIRSSVMVVKKKKKTKNTTYTLLQNYERSVVTSPICLQEYISLVKSNPTKSLKTGIFPKYK